MVNEKEIKNIIQERAELHSNDPRVSDYWDKIANALSVNEQETTDFLKKCNDKELYWVSECFEDISYKFQSKSFVDFLKELAKEHPDAEMDVDIMFAERVIIN